MSPTPRAVRGTMLCLLRRTVQILAFVYQTKLSPSGTVGRKYPSPQPRVSESQMKIRRLSEIDLARIGPLDREDKLHRLRMLKAGRPPHTYNPLRSSLGDILNLQPEIFGSGGEYTPWHQIAADIEKRAASESEADFNLAVAAALYEFGVEKQARSYSKPIAPWAVGYGQSVKYWWNLYTVIEKRPCIVFVDPRISNPLTQIGRKYVL